MRYVSTRGQAPVTDFETVLLSGLAPDGGLYVPENWPAFGPREFSSLAKRPYAETAVRVMAPFLDDWVPPDAFEGMVEAAYAGFDHADTAPLTPLGSDEWLLELFHGPTLAFKDFALQILGHLFDHALARRGEHRTIVVATSGDTGSAAIEAFRDKESLNIIVLHPKGRITDMQRRQMTTVDAANVFNVAIEGTFDDCQALLKAMFADTGFRDRHRLSAVNSINWARIMAQAAYYFHAASRLDDSGAGVSFAVPTGNFGDVYAGYAAARMGLPVRQLIVATNRNDILARTLNDGEYRMAGVTPTISPSMDIEVASNFERLLFEVHGRDGGEVERLMTELAADGGFRLEAAALEAIGALFTAHAVDEETTKLTIATVKNDSGVLVDPHTAVAIAAARACRREQAVPMIVLATAHAAKFPDAVTEATGSAPGIPPLLAAVAGRQERYQVLPNDLAMVQAYIEDSAPNEGAGAR